MFGARYFGARYFGPRYWGKVGISITLVRFQTVTITKRIQVPAGTHYIEGFVLRDEGTSVYLAPGGSGIGITGPIG